jgi:hypothetical protein
MKNGGWLDKYEQGGMVLEQKINDNYGKRENANEGYSTAGPGWIGEGTTNKGFNYNGAWGGQFQKGGFLQPTSSKLPEGYVIPYSTPSTELSISIGGEEGEPAYLIPSFKYGKKLKDPIDEYRKTGEHLGGPFKTLEDAEKFGQMRHKYVEKAQNIPSPLKWWGDDNMAMGGTIPGSVGFTYARTKGIPSEGPYAKKTLPSAQNGEEMKYYQEGLDFKPKIISKNGGDIINAQDGRTMRAANAEFSCEAFPRGKDKSATVTNGSATGFSNAPITWNELVKYNETNPKDKVFKSRLKDLQSQFPGLTSEQLLAAQGDSARIKQRMSNLPRYDKPAEQTYDKAYHQFYRTMMDQLTPVTTPQILQFHSQKPGGLPGYQQTVQSNYGRPKAENGGWLDAYDVPKAQNGVIQDDRGQWAHPGEITQINSPYITMEGVPYPVLGIADTGEEQMMYPGQDYKFEGAKYVTEYPKGKRPKKAKNGVNQADENSLVQLDQLTNFTNYNKPTMGGWLDKYN